METHDLERMIRDEEVFNEEIIRENGGDGFRGMIERLLEEKGVSKAEVIKALNVDRNYGYQILNGSRNPTRRQIVQMGLLLGLDSAQVQKLLTLAGRNGLYVRRPEDARVLYCLEHDMDYDKACEFIWGNE